jgi:hypothetical protein
MARTGVRMQARDRLVLPWNEDRRRLPWPYKAFMVLVGVAVFVGVLVSQCSVQEAGAESYWNGSHIGTKRAVEALESIADSLKKIERKMK